MNYKKIWEKVLSTDEKVEFEFSIGSRYINFYLIIWAIVILPFLFIKSVGLSIQFVIVFLFVLFYYGFYLKMANAYALTNKRVLVHKGWLSTKLISIDYSKITDIKVREPFLSRVITSTGQLLINTAGTNLHEVILNHIETPYEVKKRLDFLKDR